MRSYNAFCFATCFHSTICCQNLSISVNINIHHIFLMVAEHSVFFFIVSCAKGHTLACGLHSGPGESICQACTLLLELPSHSSVCFLEVA